MIEIINGKAYFKVGDKVYEVGGGSGIDVASAEVGQTIKVKAVDENGKPTKWEAVDFPEGGDSLPEVVLTTPVDMGTQFTAEENAALSAALATGKPVIVKSTIMETPSVVMVMNNFAGQGFVAVYANYNFLLVDTGEGWSALIEEMRVLPEVTEDDEGAFVQVSGGVYTLVRLQDVSKEGA
jgi:hypothetical protein